MVAHSNYKKFTQDQRFRIVEANVLKYGKMTCEYCESNKCIWNIDHIKPLNYCGMAKTENGQLLCDLCNSMKGGKSISKIDMKKEIREKWITKFFKFPTII